MGMVVKGCGVGGVDGWLGAGLLASSSFLSIESSEAEKVRSPPSPVPRPLSHLSVLKLETNREHAHTYTHIHTPGSTRRGGGVLTNTSVLHN